MAAAAPDGRRRDRQVPIAKPSLAGTLTILSGEVTSDNAIQALSILR
jgi:hypothetical protein